MEAIYSSETSGFSRNTRPLRPRNQNLHCDVMVTYAVRVLSSSLFSSQSLFLVFPSPYFHDCIRYMSLVQSPRWYIIKERIYDHSVWIPSPVPIHWYTAINCQKFLQGDVTCKLKSVNVHNFTVFAVILITLRSGSRGQFCALNADICKQAHFNTWTH
jgi:hypothetical protein